MITSEANLLCTDASSVDKFWLKQAYEVALFSEDPSTQNGAVLVDPHTGRFVTQACNAFSQGVESTSERWERPKKYEFVEHAERNVLYKAAREGYWTSGLVMYCPWFACADCARAIIQCGITRVVGHNLPAHEDNPRWKDSIATAMIMLQEAGVITDYLDGTIAGVQIRMNGSLVYV